MACSKVPPRLWFGAGSGGLMETSKLWDVGVGKVLASLSSWLHHRSGQIYLCTCTMLKTLQDLKELEMVLSSVDSHSGHSRGCWAAASGREGSLLWLQRASRLYLALLPGEVVLWGLGGSREEESIPKQHSLPLCRVPEPHTQSPAHLLCAWHQPRGPRKGISQKNQKNIPSFWNSAGHFPSLAWQWHCPPGAAARDTRCLSPRVTLAFQCLTEDDVRLAVKIKSSFKMCSGFCKYKLIFTCESASLLIPSPWQARDLV